MKIAAIIPAFNEESRIENVLNAVKKVEIIDEIIVVDDGSEDNTYHVAVKNGIKAIRLEKNQGKGGAIMKGVHSTDADTLVLLDADLIGLTPEHITDLIEPILGTDVQMTYGLFSDGRLATDFAQKVAPFLTGQRVVKREIFQQLAHLEISRFGMEVALTRYVRKNNIPSVGVPMANMTHVMKEEKLGLFKGFSARLKMYWEIIKIIKIS
ncbi:glycosyltransferase family 2 protein [Irregularibacter muris]|uniref:Glucosyl-3-phosphoglycerate synthase n=1 Tax=Irregularibacter muris TaxID=1796619 RepID=A0AAE3KZD1_9FIRM|nr:glycosyltransferase family 2 protein [Irregularibacter muris]MCR1898112.1 glycosyltransferase family 2 protein [Irregularibacter muris]